jgi:hypothetical protein
LLHLTTHARTHARTLMALDTYMWRCGPADPHARQPVSQKLRCCPFWLPFLAALSGCPPSLMPIMMVAAGGDAHQQQQQQRSPSTPTTTSLPHAAAGAGGASCRRGCSTTSSLYSATYTSIMGAGLHQTITLSPERDENLAPDLILTAGVQVIFRSGSRKRKDCLLQSAQSQTVLRLTGRRGGTKRALVTSESGPESRTSGELAGGTAIVDVVFSFLGKGHWLFAAGVCRFWKQRYAKCYGRKTSPVAAIASVGCLEMGITSGLDLGTEKIPWVFADRGIKAPRLETLRYLMGARADAEVILLAKSKGMVCDTEICAGAARAGRLEVLKRLHLEHQFPIDDELINYCAVKAPTPAVLEWLAQIGRGSWTEESLLDIMHYAAYCGRVGSCKWLMEKFALQLEDFMLIYSAACGNHIDFIKWALSNDCPSNWYDGACADAMLEGATRETIEWLHNHVGIEGCCTNPHN